MSDSIEAFRALTAAAFQTTRADFLDWALPQCRTGEQREFARALAQAIGDVSFAEAQAALVREVGVGGDQ